MRTNASPIYSLKEILEAFPPAERPKKSRIILLPGPDKSTANTPISAIPTQGVLEVDKIESALSAISPDIEYSIWLKMGMALHQGSGGSEEGFTLWDNWSRKGKQYDSKEMRKKWQSLKTCQGITLATLFWQAQQAGWKCPVHLAQGTVKKPQIVIEAGGLYRSLQACDEAIRQAGLSIFKYKNTLVYVESSLPRLTRVTVDWLLPKLEEIADFIRFDSRKNTVVKTGCPQQIARSYIASVDDLKIRRLDMISLVPLLREDGSVFARGYDEQSETLCHFDLSITIPENPGKSEAIAAMKLFKDMLEEFPFETDADRSVIIAAILAALVRFRISATPLHLIDSPVAGSGKSLLVKIISLIVTGSKPMLLSYTNIENENEKRLGAALLETNPIICLDNISHSLKGDFFCSYITEKDVTIRILGLSQVISIKSSSVLLVTGNNISLEGDLSRRTLICRIDPKVESPERRCFKNPNIEEWVIKNRGKLVAAGLTILKAFSKNADQKQTLTPLGSFEKWSKNIRDAIVWCGEADPCETRVRLDKKDIRKEQLRILIHSLKNNFSNEFKRVRDIIDHAENNKYGLQDILLEIASNNKEGISQPKLGVFLKKHQDTILDGLKIESKTDTHTKQNLWSIQEAT